MPTRNPLLCDQRQANLYVSRVIPWVLGGIIAYACYIFTKTLCIDYLFDPVSTYGRRPRVGTGAALLTIYYVLLFLAIVTYVRLYVAVVFNQDIIPRGANWVPDSETKDSVNRRPRRRRHSRNDSRSNNREKASRSHSRDVEASRGQIGAAANPLDDRGLEMFYTKDIFVCFDDGRPPWCTECWQFKTDRVHHSSDLGRCVRKLDHFCPWVGGVVSESSYKYFLQFVVYAAMLTGFVLIVLAVFMAELRRNHGKVNVHWAIGLALSAFFFLFTGGMSVTSVGLTASNVTTIENLSRRSKAWTLAIYIEDSTDPSKTNYPFPIVAYPIPRKSTQDESTPSYSRVFAVLQAKPGENPFDLGSPIKNLQQVLGYTLWDWLLPLKPSPCTDHSSPVSIYPMGPVVERLKQQVKGWNAETPGRRHSRHHHRR